MSQILTSMNFLKPNELRARTGAHGCLHNGQRSWPMTPDPSLIPQCRPPISEDDGPFMEPLKPHLLYSRHVRLLAVRNHISAGLLPHCSLLPINFQMFLAWAWFPPMLPHGFLMQIIHSCISLVIAKITPKGLVQSRALHSSDGPLTSATYLFLKARVPLHAYQPSWPAR